MATTNLAELFYKGQSSNPNAPFPANLGEGPMSPSPEQAARSWMTVMLGAAAQHPNPGIESAEIMHPPEELP